MDEEESILNSVDLEEEEDENSDEKAMRQFLDELKKYRQKVKKKSKEMKQSKSAKLAKSTNSVANSETKKKKRKKHKLFDPTPPKKESNEDDNKNDGPKKIISKKEYKALMKRLIKPKNEVVKNNKTQDSPTKNKEQQKTPEIFINLYDKSREAVKKRKELIEAQEKKEKEDLKTWTQPKTQPQSKLYAHNRMIQYVDDAFGNDKILSKKKLVNVLHTLGLAENINKINSIVEVHDQYNNNDSLDDEEEEISEAHEKQSQSSKSFIQLGDDLTQNLRDIFANGICCDVKTILLILQKLDLIKITKEIPQAAELNEEESELEQDNIQNENYDGNTGKQTFYEITNLKKFYSEVAKDQISTQFHIIVKEKLQIAMANEKRKPKKVYDPNKQFTTAPSLTRETLERLVPKRQKSPEQVNQNEKKDENCQPKLSEGSKKILSESKRVADDDKLLCTLPIDQRELHLNKMKEEKIEKMRQEFKVQLEQGRIFSNPLPQYDEETAQKLAKYKEDKKNRVEQEPTYRPNITKYEDFLKMQEELNSTEFKVPHGWDKDVTRHRNAYNDFIHQKRLKTESTYQLEYRINARAQLKESNQNINSNAHKSLNTSKNASSPLKKKTNRALVQDNQEEQDERVRFNFQNNESDNADIED